MALLSVLESESDRELLLKSFLARALNGMILATTIPQRTGASRSVMIGELRDDVQVL